MSLSRRFDRWSSLMLAAGLAVTLVPLTLKAQQDPDFAISSDMVLVPVSVKNDQGEAVRGLTVQDFRILSDGKQQAIRYFEEHHSPVSVLLLIDVSSSMKGAPLDEARRAARGFIQGTTAESEIALAGFNHHYQLHVDFTQERQQVESALAGLEAEGGTALFDAIVEGIRALESSRWKRRALVLLSDGKDQDSRTSFEAVESIVLSSQAAVFSVGEFSEEEREVFGNRQKYYKLPEVDVNLNPIWVLDRLAELTGGAAYFPAQGQTPVQLFERVARELRNQYLIGFHSTRDGSESSRFRSIHVELRFGAPFQVTARQGYLP